MPQPEGFHQRGRLPIQGMCRGTPLKEVSPLVTARHASKSPATFSTLSGAGTEPGAEGVIIKPDFVEKDTVRVLVLGPKIKSCLIVVKV